MRARAYALGYVNDIDAEVLAQLFEAALDARSRAYAPYSNYQVGAALLTKSGQVICGVNVENASYPLTNCAERVALGTYVEQGRAGIQAIVVATKDAGSPCGACRQVMAELAEPDCPVYAIAPDGRQRKWTVKELLPDSFVLDNH